MQMVSSGENCMKYQILFSGKNKKDSSTCCLLQILLRVLSVNVEKIPYSYSVCTLLVKIFFFSFGFSTVFVLSNWDRQAGQTVETKIRRRVLRRLIWVYTVCHSSSSLYREKQVIKWTRSIFREFWGPNILCVYGNA